MTHFVGIQYKHPFQVCEGVEMMFRDAGHILGSAGVLLNLRENGREFRLGFTGDIGRTEVPIIRDPDVLRDVDAMFMESTYGDRLHSPREDVEEELASTIRGVAKLGGKVIIPAFAVGRTQVVVYMLHKLFDQNRIPDMPSSSIVPWPRRPHRFFDHTRSVMTGKRIAFFWMGMRTRLGLIGLPTLGVLRNQRN